MIGVIDFLVTVDLLQLSAPDAVGFLDRLFA
jgi:hypothetical protein